MALITVSHRAGQAFDVRTRDHVITVDQPAAGGGESGPSPVELFVSSLAACVAHYAVEHLREHELPHENLVVECRWTLRQDPARVGRVQLAIRPPAASSPSQRWALAAAVDHCTVHNSLRTIPDITVTLATPTVEAR